MFVSFEGIDGSGKSTIIPLVKERLENQNYKVGLKSEFPSGSLSKEFLQALGKGLFLAEHLNMPPAAAFFYLLHSEVLAADEIDFDGADFIFADRYHLTHTMYQSYFASTNRDSYNPRLMLQHISNIFLEFGLALPDLIIILDVPIEIAEPRIIQREGQSVKNHEREILHIFRQMYMKLADDCSCQSVVIDASKPILSIVDEVEKAILSRHTPK